MFPVVFIKKSEKFFKNKNAGRAYLVEEYDDHFLYEIQIILDLQHVMVSKVRDFKVYLTDFTTTTQADASLSLGTSVDTQIAYTPTTAVSSVLDSGKADLFNSVVRNHKDKKHFVTVIDPKLFIDLERYKNNFKGSATDKFGLIGQISSYIESHPGKGFNNKARHDTSLVPAANAIRSKSSTNVERGLYTGTPPSEILNLKNIQEKNASSRHKITAADSWHQQDKKRIFKSKAEAEHAQNQKTMVGEYTQSQLKRQRSTIAKSANTTRTVSFLLKIKKSTIIKSKISVRKFGLLMEAEDKRNTVLDRLVTVVNLERDLRGKALSLENFNISAHEDRNSFTISVCNDAKSTIKVDLHNKSLKKDIPFYKNKYEKVSTLRISGPREKSGFRIKKSISNQNDQSSQNSAGSYRQISLDNLNVPNYFRVTPTIKTIKFDNMYEVGIKPKAEYTNSFVPIFVRSTSISGQPAAKISVDVRNIPRRYKRIKICKKDLNASLFGDFASNIKKSHNADFKEFKMLKINDYESTAGRSNGVNYDVINDINSLLSVTDVNVEAGRVYEYRVELLESVGRVNKLYSTSFFHEKIEKNTNFCSVRFEEESGRHASSNKLVMSVFVKETDAEKVYKTLLQNKFDLFESEIKEIGDITSNAIALKIERIDVETCEISTIKYLTNQASTLTNAASDGFDSNRFTVRFDDNNIDAKKDYVYKVTTCMRPVSEIITGINEEILFRNTGTAIGSGNYAFAALRRKIKNLDDKVLYNAAAHFANSANSPGGKRLIVDPETSAGNSAGNIFSNSSTGDIFYFEAFREARNDSALSGYASAGASLKESGCKNFKLKNIEYFSQKNIQTISIKDEIKNKFIVSFECTFMSYVDHCSIFMFNRGNFSHCCDMHVDTNPEIEKNEYRILVEKSGLKGEVFFYMFPITRQGAILKKVALGSRRV